MHCIKGDLIQLALAGEFDLIIHGCNCFCTMGAGIARQIRNTFPAAYEADLETRSGDRNKLGTYSQAAIPIQGNPLIILNGYTQYHHSGDQVPADYEAIDTLFGRIKRNFPGRKMGYPKIGAGLARGDWKKIKPLIDYHLAGENHTLVEYLDLQK